MSLKVLYFGTYDRDYPRNQIMIKGLRAAGVEVTECHVTLWQGTADKVAAASGKHKITDLILRVISTYVALLRAYQPLHRRYDVMMLGYTGQFDVLVARWLCWLARRPLVLDVFVSVYLSATERGLPSRTLLHLIENIACRLPDLLIIDTGEYAEWFEQTYGITRTRFQLVPIGADNSIFKPVPRPRPDGVFRVVYYGSFIPLHGIEYILQSAALLRERRDIHFELIGQGAMRTQAQAVAVELGLERTVFTDWVAEDELPTHVASADVLLGVFGTTQASKRTIQNKIYQGLAMARPVITGDSTAVRAALTHGQHAYLVERGNPAALADAILTLQRDPDLRTRLAKEGHRLFLERYTVEAIGRQMREHLEKLLSRQERR